MGIAVSIPTQVFPSGSDSPKSVESLRESSIAFLSISAALPFRRLSLAPFCTPEWPQWQRCCGIGVGSAFASNIPKSTAAPRSFRMGIRQLAQCTLRDLCISLLCWHLLTMTLQPAPTLLASFCSTNAPTGCKNTEEGETMNNHE